MNDFLELAKKRFSCRKFEQKKVPDHILKLVTEAGRIAPSAVNFQPWKFIVVREEQNVKMIHDVYHREWINAAPAVIIVCADHTQSWKRKADAKDFADVDAAIAIDHMTLEATSLGLGTCWVCNFDVEKAKKVLALPETLEPIALLPVGYPVDESDPQRHHNKRKPHDEVVQWEF